MLSDDDRLEAAQIAAREVIVDGLGDGHAFYLKLAERTYDPQHRVFCLAICHEILERRS